MSSFILCSGPKQHSNTPPRLSTGSMKKPHSELPTPQSHTPTHLDDGGGVLLSSTVHGCVSISVLDVSASLALVEKLLNATHVPLFTGQV